MNTNSNLTIWTSKSVMHDCDEKFLSLVFYKSKDALLPPYKGLSLSDGLEGSFWPNQGMTKVAYHLSGRVISPSRIIRQKCQECETVSHLTYSPASASLRPSRRHLVEREEQGSCRRRRRLPSSKSDAALTRRGRKTPGGTETAGLHGNQSTESHFSSPTFRTQPPPAISRNRNRFSSLLFSSLLCLYSQARVKINR